MESVFLSGPDHFAYHYTAYSDSLGFYFVSGLGPGFNRGFDLVFFFGFGLGSSCLCYQTNPINLILLFLNWYSHYSLLLV